MFAKYVSTTTATLAQIIADIAALASGAALAALSASCDKTTSTQVSTVAPGWTLVDSAAASSGQVVTAPDASGLTTKYVRIFAASASTIDLAAYESWNATTHVGSNGTAASGQTLPFTAGVVNTYWVLATPRTLWVTTGANGMGAVEISRDVPYLAGTTYPVCVIAPGVSLGYTNSSQLPRIKKTNATGDSTGATAAVTSCAIASRTAASGASAERGARDAAETFYYPMLPIWLGVSNDANTAAAYPLVLGRVYDIFTIYSGAGNPIDTISDGTDTYVLLYGSNDLLAMKAA